MSRARRILAIDDSLTIRKLLELSLGKAGYSLELATTGKEGIQRAQRNPPHIILLDFVLPDMKGSDVVAALAGEERTRSIPVIIMSAKSEDVRGLFKDVPSVVEFISKPFTPPEIKFQVANVIERCFVAPQRQASTAAIPAVTGSSARTPAVTSVTFTYRQKEAAANVIFGKLRDRFAQIPAWLPQMGSENPALFYARKILTPDTMDAMLSGLAPVIAEALPRGGSEPPVEASVLQGVTSLLSLSALLKLLNSCSRTGLLTLDHGESQTILYLRKGELVLVTTTRPEDYTRQSSANLAGIPDEELERAENEQRQSGRPSFVALVERGLLEPGELSNIIYEQGKRVLMDAIEAGPATFRWLELAAVPDFVEAHARTYALEQLSLERLRKVDDWAQVELHVNSVDLVFERTPQFLELLRRLDLNDKERRILMLVDRSNTVKKIIERTNAPTFEVFHTLFCLSHTGLIRKAGEVPEPSASDVVRPVLIVESDVENIQQPLEQILAKRPGGALPLVNANGVANLLELCLEERPGLVVIGADVNGTDLCALARAVRSTLEISDTPLVVLQDFDDEEQRRELLAAGFSTVLVKPFAHPELTKWIAA